MILTMMMDSCMAEFELEKVFRFERGQVRFTACTEGEDDVDLF